MTAFHDITPFLAGSNWHHDGVWWFPFGLLWVVFLAAVIWFVVRNTRQRGPSATDILAERYARGELSSEEYRERLAELRSHQ
jgi:putative membrane protein